MHFIAITKILFKKKIKSNEGTKKILDLVLGSAQEKKNVPSSPPTPNLAFNRWKHSLQFILVNIRIYEYSSVHSFPSFIPRAFTYDITINKYTVGITTTGRRKGEETKI